MFARSRRGRRAPPSRLNVERLEDRVVPSGHPLGAGSAVAALVGPAAVAPRPDGPAHDPGGPHFDLGAGKHAGPAEDHGPSAVVGRGHGSESEGPGAGWQGEPSSGHTSAAHATPSDRQGEGGKSSGSGTVLGRDKLPDTTAGKGQKTSDDDGSDSEASARHASSADHSSGSILGRGASSPAAEHSETAETATPQARVSSAPAEEEGSEAAGPAGQPAAGRAADGGLMGPVAAAATPAAGDSGTGTAARPAAAPSGVPVPVLSRLAAAPDAGDDGAPEAAHAPPTAGAEGALAVLDPRQAGPAAPHGAAGVNDDFLAVPVAGEIILVRGGTLAEAADLGDAGAPAVTPAPYVEYSGLSAPAGGLLDRLALDTRALDAALQNFLHGLDRLGERLADPRARLGLSAWLLSGAAALAVVELNRRRRAAAADGAADVPLTWPGLPGPAPEPAS